MKAKIDPIAAAQEIAEAKAEIHRLAARVQATRLRRFRVCPARPCLRARMCLGGEAACAPKPSRPRKPISRAELMRRVRNVALQKVAELSRAIAASAR
ncbi:MAG TPA: hypothetical protein VN930_09740 [Xanthobacteraceae bacterium]|nr:hypothetical protein [Xanthobacteraceae bacterium]